MPTAVRRGHIDGAATQRMFLKRRRRRLVAVSAATLTSGFDFQYAASYASVT